MYQTKESKKRASGRVVIYISVHLVFFFNHLSLEPVEERKQEDTLAFSYVLLVLEFMVHLSQVTVNTV